MLDRLLDVGAAGTPSVVKAIKARIHMLAWLHVVFSHEVEDEKYLGTTEGVVTALPDGRCWISEVIMKPRITFNSQHQVAASAIAHFHELAQRDCFIMTGYCVEKTLPGSRITREGRLLLAR